MTNLVSARAIFCLLSISACGVQQVTSSDDEIQENTAEAASEGPPLKLTEKEVFLLADNVRAGDEESAIALLDFFRDKSTLTRQNFLFKTRSMLLLSRRGYCSEAKKLSADEYKNVLSEVEIVDIKSIAEKCGKFNARFNLQTGEPLNDNLELR